MAATQEKSLSQFPTAAQILLTTLVFGSVVDATSSSGYDSVKILVSDLAEAILGDFAYTQDLATDAKTIFGAINSIRVLSGTATPNDADGANGQIYVKYASADYSVVALYVKLNDVWREISTGGGGGGASVQMGTTTPTAASGSDGDLYVQYDGTTYEVVAMFVKINGGWREIPLGVVDIYPDAIADEYDSTATYTAGDYVMYNGKLYRCNHIGATGTWEPSWWDETSATDYTGSVNTALTTQINNIREDTADAYSSSSTYAVGDLCIAFGRLYRCTTAISTPEAWNASHWAATTIADEIAAKANSSNVYTKTQVDTALLGKEDALSKGTGNLNANNLYGKNGYYRNVSGNISNCPVNDGNLIVMYNGEGNSTMQLFFPSTADYIYLRMTWAAGTVSWTTWKKILFTT